MNDEIQPLDADKVPTVANCVRRYLAHMKPRWAGNTLARVGLATRLFATFVGTRTLTPLIVSEFQAAQYTRDIKQSTLNEILFPVQQFLQWCEDMEILAHNRFSGIIKLPLIMPSKPQAFTHSQYEALKEVSKGTMWHYAIIMAYRIGTRYSDTAIMKWEYINMEKLYVQFVPHKTRKTGREAVCPFDSGGDLHRVLIELNQSRHANPMWSNYVCPEMAMTYPQIGPRHAPAIRRYEFKRMCIKIGAGDLSFHNLRNSFISRLVKSGTTHSIGGQLTGLSSPAVFNQYAVPDMDTLRRAVDNMSKNDNPPDEGIIIKLPGAA